MLIGFLNVGAVQIGLQDIAAGGVSENKTNMLAMHLLIRVATMPPWAPQAATRRRFARACCSPGSLVFQLGHVFVSFVVC